ncbi:MAG: ABC transporter ATP-binding protein [Pseudomonadales bacterium]
METFEDDVAIDGIDEEAAARRLNLALWRKLASYVVPYKKELAWLAFFALLLAAADVALPLVPAGAIDEVIANGQNASFTPWIMLFVVATIAMAISVGGFIWMAGKIRAHLSHDIRRDGFENLQRLSFSFYDRRPVGWLMARMTSDCDRLANILAWGFLDLIWGTSLMLGIAIVMLVMSPKLALVVLSTIPVIAVLSAKFQRKILRSAREVRRTNSRITGAFNEAIMGVLTSKAFVREDENLSDFQRLTGQMLDASVTNQLQAAVYVPLILTLASLAMGMVLAFGGFDLAQGFITAGALVAFLQYARHFFDPIEQLGRWFAEMQMAQASAERIISLVEAEPEIQDEPDVLAAMEAQRSAPARASIAPDGGPRGIQRIELKNVSFSYSPDQPVLQNVNLAVNAGETIAVVGPTGGGKSTLVSIICRFYEPTSGQVLIDGIDYRKRSLHWLQSNLGMVLQSSHIFGGSIMDNIRYGRLDATDDEVKEATRLAGAHEFIEAMEEGYGTDVGETGSRLSAGQKQLVSYARAILADPLILVMDEATSSVDTETERKIQLALANVLRGRISFVIAHRLSTIRNADRIVVIEGGRITEEGTHDELVKLGGHYYELYRQQSLQESTKQVAGWDDASRQPA